MTDFSLAGYQMDALLRCIFLAEYHTMCDERGRKLDAEKMLETGWMVHEFHDIANYCFEEIFPSFDPIPLDAVKAFLRWIEEDGEEQFKYYDE